MPKFLAVNVIVKVYETYAQSEDDGHDAIRKFCEDDSEEIEGGVKATRYKLGWCEFKLSDEAIIHGRNEVLATFLDLMNRLPNTPPPKPSPIVRPYDPFPDVIITTEESKIEKKVQAVIRDIKG